ncbi:hypothetical protein CFP56_018466, partial [Quercus suber]
LAVSVVYDNNNRKSKHTIAVLWVPYASNNIVLGEHMFHLVEFRMVSADYISKGLELKAQ